ncbi:hypothetical protein PN498_03375 [Oscillatoria sp. CS-180]|uniref:hypothetical protein n=1 Tax=Oscillatoria sp. CS-180 TaxID=3021720 RepID=UPI00232BAB97|nr:hypothetical protein [Oscillatoria sp. CS-180]MDB9525017.1 hypothetical protein [Oscillatoria sp. CS-180]
MGDKNSAWYIVKGQSGQCEISTVDELETNDYTEKWGPFETQSDAIAKRVGLIRAGKCQPR